MAKQNLENLATFGVQRAKINENFTELYGLVEGISDIETVVADYVFSKLETIYLKNFGIDASGVEPASQQIQSVINNNIGKVISMSPTDVYKIDKTINIPTGTRFNIEGTLKLQDGAKRLLIEDMTASQNYIMVADAATHFSVGQRVAISANNQPINGGGSWKTRKVGQTGVISSIVGDRINFTNNISNWLVAPPTVAQGAIVSQYNSVLNIDKGSNIIISGSGVLDGNLANQLNVAATNYGRFSEDLKGACGVGFNDSKDIIIKGITIKGMVLHGMACGFAEAPFIKSYNVKVGGVTFDGSVDKAFVGIGFTNSSITNFVNKNGVDEGEIALYSDNTNVLIANGYSENNRRYGVALIGNNAGITIDNLRFRDNIQSGLYVQNSTITTLISNISFTGTKSVGGCIGVNASSNVRFSNVQLFDLTNTLYGISISSGTVWADKAQSISFTGLSIKNFTGFNSVAISIGDCYDSVFQNFSLKNVDRCFNDVSGNSNIRFINGNIETTKLLSVGAMSKEFKFSNVVGDYTFENSQNVQFPIDKKKIIISHGMSIKPLEENIMVEAINSLGNATKWFVSDINSDDFTLNLNTEPTTEVARLRWKIETIVAKNTPRPIYLNNYVSNFSSGVDGWAGTRATLTGANMGVSDGITSLDSVLKIVPTIDSGTHEFSKAMLVVGKKQRIRMKYFIPTTSTVNGLRLFINGFAATVIRVEQGEEKHVVGKWVEISTPEFTPLSTGVIFRIYKGTTTSFVGDIANDVINIKDVIVEYID